MTGETNSILTPFFVVGCARTGTTLLRVMLNHHKDIAIPPESLFMVDYMRTMDDVPLERFRRLVLGEYELSEWEVDVSPEALTGCTSLAQIFDVLYRAYLEANGKRVPGQKTPRFIRYGALVKSVYPEARFIHVIRDARAVANSLKRSNVHSSNVYYGAKRWLKDTQAGLDLKQQYPDDVLEITYEDLVSDTETTLRTVCGFIGVDFDPAMLRYHQTEHAEYDTYHEKIHARLQEPPKQTRIDAWQKQLTAGEIQLVESMCAPLMRQLGYEPLHADPAPPPGLIRQMVLQRQMVGFWKQLGQYFNGRTYHLFYSIWRKYRLGLLTKDTAQVNY